MSDYIRFDFDGFYFEYSKKDIEPEIYWNNSPDGLMSLLIERKKIIKNVIASYQELRYAENETLINNFKNIHKHLINIENEINVEYGEFVNKLDEYNSTPEKYNYCHSYEEQDDFICKQCGNLIAYQERKKYQDMMNALIWEGKMDEALEKYCAYCPFCKETHLIGYYNIYLTRAKILEKKIHALINNKEFEKTIAVCYEQISLYEKIDPFYKDDYGVSLREIGNTYGILFSISKQIKNYNGIENIAKKSVEYFTNASTVGALYDPIFIMNSRMDLLEAKILDPNIDKVEIQEIEENISKLNAEMNMSYTIYNNLDKNTYDQVISECEKTRIQCYINVIVIMKRFRYNIFVINKWKKFCKQVIEASKSISEQEKKRALLHL